MNLKFGRILFFLMVLAAQLSSCSFPSDNSTPINQPGQDPAAQLNDPTNTPLISTETPKPTRTANPFPNPTLRVVGEEEVVFDWSTDRCAYSSIPDLPSRAIQDISGLVQLFISNTVMYRMIGPDLNNVSSECTPVFSSLKSADPSLFSDNEWIGSFYTEDGQTIYGLIHNEYQGHTHYGMCPQADYFPCWYNTITLAISTDGGQSYDHAAEAPGHLVASLPYPYEAGAGPDGLRAPSNIIKGKDNLFYVFLNLIDYKTQKQWVCLMRTGDLSDPKSWRYWDGAGFEGVFIDPYLDPTASPDAHKCAPLAIDDIGASLNDSITYNTYLERYVLVGISADQIDGREVWGFFYSFSDDLIHWTHRKLLMEIELPWTVDDPGNDLSYLYPSLLDPNSDSLSFSTTGKTAYLYFTRNNFGHASLDRDLIRVMVEFFPDNSAP